MLNYRPFNEAPTSKTRNKSKLSNSVNGPINNKNSRKLIQPNINKDL